MGGKRGMGESDGAGDGVSANPEKVSGRREAGDGGAVVPAGIHVRIRGRDERGIRYGAGAAGDHGRSEAAGVQVGRDGATGMDNRAGPGAGAGSVGDRGAGAGRGAGGMGSGDDGLAEGGRAAAAVS